MKDLHQHVDGEACLPVARPHLLLGMNAKSPPGLLQRCHISLDKENKGDI